MGNLSVEYIGKGDYQRAVDYVFRSIKIFDKIHDKRSVMVTTHTLGIIFSQQKQYDRAKVYFEKGLKMAREQGDMNIQGEFLNSLAEIYTGQKQYDKALEMHQKALAIHISMENDFAANVALIGTADLYYETKEYDSLLFYSRRSREVAEKIGSKYDRLMADMYAARALSGLKRYNEAGRLFAELDTASVDIKELPLRSKLHEFEYSFYKDTKQFKKAIKAYAAYILYRDSISNEESNKEQVRTELKYEY